MHAARAGHLTHRAPACPGVSCTTERGRQGATDVNAVSARERGAKSGSPGARSASRCPQPHRCGPATPQSERFQRHHSETLASSDPDIASPPSGNQAAPTWFSQYLRRGRRPVNSLHSPRPTPTPQADAMSSLTDPTALNVRAGPPPINLLTLNMCISPRMQC